MTCFNVKRDVCFCSSEPPTFRVCADSPMLVQVDLGLPCGTVKHDDQDWGSRPRSPRRHRIHRKPGPQGTAVWANWNPHARALISLYHYMLGSRVRFSCIFDIMDPTRLMINGRLLVPPINGDIRKSDANTLQTAIRLSAPSWAPGRRVA